MRIWLLAAGLILTSASASVADYWDYDSKNPPSERDAATASTQTGQNPQSALEVVAVEEAQLAAWNRHDLQGYFLAYLRSSELISISEGDQIVGYDAYCARISKSFGNDLASMGEMKEDRLQVKVFSGLAMAMVRATYTLRTPKHVYDIEATELLRRTAEGWRIAFENDSVRRH